MREASEREREQARKEDSMLVVEGEKISEAEIAGLHFFKQMRHAIPLVAPRGVDSVAENQIAQTQGGKRKDKKGEGRSAKRITSFICVLVQLGRSCRRPARR